MTPLEIVRCYYDSLVPGQRQVLMEILDPKVVLELPEGFPGTAQSYVGLRAYMEDFLYGLYGSFELDFFPEEFLEAGSRIVVLGRQKAVAINTGLPVEAPFVHIWTVEDGRIVHIWMFTDTALFRDAVEGHPARAQSA